VVDVFCKWLITLMQDLAGLHVHNLFNVTIIVFVDSAVNTHKLPVLMAMLHARILV